MNDELLSIGKMAALNHTSVPTLRLYDQEGLLHPAKTDPDSGYRYYTIRQSARFDMIQYMKELGMSLKEIRELLDKEDLDLIEEILIRKRRQTDDQIEKLRLQQMAIDRTVESIRRYRCSPSPGTITLEYIEDRRIYAIPSSENFYEKGLSCYERLLKELKEDLIRRRIPQVYYFNAGTSIEREDFEALRFAAKDLFVFVDDNFPQMTGTTVLKSGMYACIYLDSFDEELPYARQLLEYCRRNGWRIDGEYICQVMTEFNIFDDSRRSMFLRLQVPVSFANDIDSHPA